MYGESASISLACGVFLVIEIARIPFISLHYVSSSPTTPSPRAKKNACCKTFFNNNRRFEDNSIYTNVADVLVSINPYTDIPGLYEIPMPVSCLSWIDVHFVVRMVYQCVGGFIH